MLIIISSCNCKCLLLRDYWDNQKIDCALGPPVGDRWWWCAGASEPTLCLIRAKVETGGRRLSLTIDSTGLATNGLYRSKNTGVGYRLTTFHNWILYILNVNKKHIFQITLFFLVEIIISVPWPFFFTSVVINVHTYKKKCIDAYCIYFTE